MIWYKHVTCILNRRIVYRYLRIIIIIGIYAKYRAKLRETEEIATAGGIYTTRHVPLVKGLRPPQPFSSGGWRINTSRCYNALMMEMFSPTHPFPSYSPSAVVPPLPPRRWWKSAANSVEPFALLYLTRAYDQPTDDARAIVPITVFAASYLPPGSSHRLPRYNIYMIYTTMVHRNYGSPSRHSFRAAARTPPWCVTSKSRVQTTFIVVI